MPHLSINLKQAQRRALDVHVLVREYIPLRTDARTDKCSQREGKRNPRGPVARIKVEVKGRIFIQRVLREDPAHSLRGCANAVYVLDGNKEKTINRPTNHPDEKELPSSYTDNAAEMPMMLVIPRQDNPYFSAPVVLP